MERDLHTEEELERSRITSFEYGIKGNLETGKVEETGSSLEYLKGNTALPIP